MTQKVLRDSRAPTTCPERSITTVSNTPSLLPIPSLSILPLPAASGAALLLRLLWLLLRLQLLLPLQLRRLLRL